MIPGVGIFYYSVFSGSTTGTSVDLFLMENNRTVISSLFPCLRKYFTSVFHYADLSGSDMEGLSKSTLLRAFTKSKGVTPYSYLQNIRIGEAKKLLEQGLPPVEAALQTGFSDQSHFTNYFNRYIGLAPGVYREIFLMKENSEDKKQGK